MFSREERKIKRKKRARILQSETFSLWEKPNSPGAQEQAPRGNRTQVKKACMTVEAAQTVWRVWAEALSPQHLADLRGADGRDLIDYV